MARRKEAMEETLFENVTIKVVKESGRGYNIFRAYAFNARGNIASAKGVSRAHAIGSLFFVLKDHALSFSYGRFETVKNAKLGEIAE